MKNLPIITLIIITGLVILQMSGNYQRGNGRKAYEIKATHIHTLKR